MNRNSFFIYLFLLLLAQNLVAIEIAPHTSLSSFTDSIEKTLGGKNRDLLQTRKKYAELFNDYYDKGDIDSLRLATAAYMSCCVSGNDEHNRYVIWRQYIQRIAEIGLQKEAMDETEQLRKYAAATNSLYGEASSEMCMGYNHRIFNDNTKLCLNYYQSALHSFEEVKMYKDAFIVCLNMVQIYLTSEDYANAHVSLQRMKQLYKQLKKNKETIEKNIYLRFLQYKGITALAYNKEKEARRYKREVEVYYKENPASQSKEAWLGYKIMYCRTNQDIDGALRFLDSLNSYHRSIGVCYPENIHLKAQWLETVGRYKLACKAYRLYAAVNDSIRSVRMDEKLSKYTVKYDLSKLKMEKLLLQSKITRISCLTLFIIGIGLLSLFVFLVFYSRRMFQMNKKLNEANKSVVRMSSIKSSFIQQISHEIRTPLNSIVGFSTVIASGELKEKERNTYLIEVEKSNKYLLELVDNMIDIADMDSSPKQLSGETLAVAAICQQCVDTILPLLKKDVAFHYTPTKENITIVALPEWIKKVLLVLLSNAVKFTDKGTISLSYVQDKQKRMVRFVVEDTGCGVEEKDKELIFNRFYKVDNFTQGIGLGLPIAQKIMALVDGTIFLDTSYQQGARFVVEWPFEITTKCPCVHTL